MTALTPWSTNRLDAGSVADKPGYQQELMAPPRLEAALKRLSAALDQLEAVGSRVAQASGERRDLADTLAVMQDDRGRLAGELDAALTRTQALEHATAEVSQRLGQAGGTLRRLLDEAFVAETGPEPAAAEQSGT